MRGVRRPEELQGMDLSRRLTMRIGALLKKKLEITPTVLDSARPDSPLERFLLDPKLLAHADQLENAIVLQWVQDDSDALVQLLRLHQEGSSRVLCLEDELLADDEWSSPNRSAVPSVTIESAHAHPISTIAGQFPGHSKNLTQHQDTPAQSGELFSRLELDRLKLKAVTAADRNERIEALRILAHAPLALSDKAELLFRALEDRDAGVRAQTSELLQMLGLDLDVCASLDRLNAPQAEERARAADRLAKSIERHAANPLALGAIAAATFAAFKHEPVDGVPAQMLSLLEQCVPAMGKNPIRLAELIRTGLERYLACERHKVPFRSNDSLFPPLLRMLRALCEVAPELVLSHLREELAKATDPLSKALLLQVLLENHSNGSEETAEILKQCVRFIAEDRQETRESRAIGMLLVKHGEGAMLALCENFASATEPGQKYMLRLLDELVRFGEISVAGVERANSCVLQALEGGSRALRMTALHLMLPTVQSTSEGLRAKLARAMQASLNDFGFQTDLEIAEENLALIGLPAVGALTERMGPEQPPPIRAQALRILGHLGLHLKVPQGRMKEYAAAITELLRRLQTLLLEPNFPHKGELYKTLGKLVASPAASKQAGVVIGRHLLQAADRDLDPTALGALEGLAYLGASRRADTQNIFTILGLFIRRMDEVNLEVTAERQTIDGQEVVAFRDQEGVLELLPIVLKGCSRILSSRNCPDSMRRQTIKELVARWDRIVKGELMWGPANGLYLVQALQEIGCNPRLSPADTNLILRSLLQRLQMMPVLHAVTLILQQHDNTETAVAALAIGLNIATTRKVDGRFEAEDRPDILKALSRLAMRRHLGRDEPGEQEKARRYRTMVIDELFQGAKDLVSGVYDLLGQLRSAETLSEEERKIFEERWARYHALNTR